MTVSVTDVEKIRRLPWLVAADTLNTGFFLLTFSGSVFILFLNELGLKTGQIGFLLSLVPFCGIIAPFIAPYLARFGHKRVYLIFWTVRKFVFALILLTPVVVARFGPASAFYWVTGSIVGFALCRAIAETAGYPWRKAAVPDSIRGKFSAINSMSTTVAAIMVVTGASFVIDAGTGLGRFMLLMAVGISLGLLSIWCYAQVPGGAPVRLKRSTARHLQGMKQALADRNFLRFLLTLGLATIGGTSVISFVPLYMTEQVGLSEGNVVLLGVGTYLGALVTSYWWGWLADRYGSQPVMQFSLYLMALLPVSWFLLPRDTAFTLPLALAIAFGAGVATLAWQISWVRYLYVNAIPPRRESPYLAVYYAWFGLASGLGPLLAGQVIARSQEFTFDSAFFNVNPYTPLFGLSVILLIVGVITVAPLRSEDATPFRRLAGMFLRGNPIRALESLIQYNFSGTELSRVTLTERMGDAQNPLSTRELIEALNDPSYNVRYEAIHSIGRMPPERELVDALLAALQEGQSELSFVIIQALGRLGDPRAVEPLRDLLDSGYHLLEAHSARALARLGDTDSIPRLLAKFRTEPNPVLRIAYSSALGTLRSTEAIEEIFTLLRQTCGEARRGEIGLALARIAGDEQYYMQHWPALRANLDTATAQAILALQKKISRLTLDTLADLAGQCAESFARQDSNQGRRLLRAMIDQLPPAGLDRALLCILGECKRDLAEGEEGHLEVLLLSLHTFDIALEQLDSLPVESPVGRQNSSTSITGQT